MRRWWSAFPDAGVELARFNRHSLNPRLARKDADWHLDELYDFVDPLDATVLSTKLSRSIIDVNRDPSGASLYPGQATTELCPPTHVRRRAALSGGASTGRIVDCRKATVLLRSISQCARPRDRAPAREVQARRAIRRTLHSFAYPASLRRRIARVQSRDQFRGRAVIRQSARRSEKSWRRPKKAWSSTDGSRAAGSHAPTGSRIRASRPCNSSSPAGPICRSPGARRSITGRRRST